MRRPHARWTVAACAFVAVLVGGLFTAGFLSSPGGSYDDPPVAAGPRASVATPPPNPASPAGPRSVRQAEYPSEIPAAARASLPYNPLNHLDGSDVHTVVLRVTSRADAGFGYLVPTGLTDTYGKKTTRGSSWRLSQKALGPGNLAILFIQADAKGTPLRCEITVDGKVTSTETVSRPFARALCLG